MGSYTVTHPRMDGAKPPADLHTYASYSECSLTLILTLTLTLTLGALRAGERSNFGLQKVGKA